MPLNNKGRLQEYTVKNGLASPLYRTSSTGQSHTPTWKCTVSVGAQTVDGDSSETKKEAEMSAAYRMLDILTGRVVERSPHISRLSDYMTGNAEQMRRTIVSPMNVSVSPMNVMVTLLIDCDTHWMMLQEMSSGVPANLRVWAFSREPRPAEPFNPIDPIRNVGTTDPHVALCIYFGAELLRHSDVIFVASSHCEALLAAAKGLCGTKAVFAVNTYREILEVFPGM